jgi:hypothetical protein
MSAPRSLSYGSARSSSPSPRSSHRDRVVSGSVSRTGARWGLELARACRGDRSKLSALRMARQGVRAWRPTRPAGPKALALASLFGGTHQRRERDDLRPEVAVPFHALPPLLLSQPPTSLPISSIAFMANP